MVLRGGPDPVGTHQVGLHRSLSKTDINTKMNIKMRVNIKMNIKMRVKTRIVYGAAGPRARLCGAGNLL